MHLIIMGRGCVVNGGGFVGEISNLAMRTTERAVGGDWAGLPALAADPDTSG